MDAALPFALLITVQYCIECVSHFWDLGQSSQGHWKQLSHDDSHVENSSEPEGQEGGKFQDLHSDESSGVNERCQGEVYNHYEETSFGFSTCREDLHLVYGKVFL